MKHFRVRAHSIINSRLFLSLLACATLIGCNLAATRSASALFDIGNGGGGTSLPASCDISKLLAQNKVLLAEIQQTNDQQQADLKRIMAEQSNLKPGDTAGGAALDAEQQQVLDSSKAKLAEIQAQQDAIKKQTQGPSDQCKRDTVANSIAEMQRVQSVIGGSVVTSSFNQIDTEVAKIEALEPTLQSKGVNNKDMQTIKTSVAAVKADSATLRSFLSTMSSKAAAFINQASADPIGTYNAMQGGGGPLGNAGAGAKTAMTSLVSSFTNLVNLFDKLSGNNGGQ